MRDTLKRPRLIVVSPTDLSAGRGAENILAGVLPALTRRVDVLVLSLGPSGPEFAAVAARCGARVVELDYRTSGWFVRHADDVARRVVVEAARWSADLVVLYWEIWDLVRAFARVLPSAGVRFRAFFHALPFAYAPGRPGSFYLDGMTRVLQDRDPLAVWYTALRLHQVERVLARVPVVSANETVSYYLRHYFPQLPFTEASPLCALDLPADRFADDVEKRYDCVFMAKLIPGKGIHQLPVIFARIAAHRPDARLLVIGTFEREADRRRFYTALTELGLSDRVDLAGWLRGSEKYRALASGRLFLYPSYAADTFAIALLEALACGVPAVTYDVPFARAVYRTPAVRRCAAGNTDAFADAALGILDAVGGADLSREAERFASAYSSWERVAEGQLTAFGNRTTAVAPSAAGEGGQPTARPHLPVVQFGGGPRTADSGPGRPVHQD
jgi:glycosyltransferase involved in cell wall biosynthesis